MTNSRLLQIEGICKQKVTRKYGQNDGMYISGFRDNHGNVSKYIFMQCFVF